MPRISVIVPVYKVETYLYHCVDSILNQTFTDFELILVDDGSPDRCPAICDEYKEKDSRVRVIHQQNGGPSAARNAGIDWAFANSDSDWIYFADSDDWIHPMSFEILMTGAQQTGLDVVIGGYECTEAEGGNPIRELKDPTPEIWKTDIYFCEQNTNAVVPWGKLYKKECFCNVRYPLGKIYEDEFTTYKILFQYDKIAVINQPLYAYFQNPDGLMGIGWKTGRLAALPALTERTEYFRSIDNEKMFLWSLHAVFGNLRWNIKEIRQSSEEIKKRYEEQTVRQYKKLLKTYREFLPIASNGNIYEFVYPVPFHMLNRSNHARELGFTAAITYYARKVKTMLCRKSV